MIVTGQLPWAYVAAFVYTLSAAGGLRDYKASGTSLFSEWRVDAASSYPGMFVSKGVDAGKCIVWELFGLGS